MTFEFDNETGRFTITTNDPSEINYVRREAQRALDTGNEFKLEIAPRSVRVATLRAS
jgi:hypothetical protein